MKAMFYDGFIISGRDISFAPKGIENGQKHEIRRVHNNNFRLIQRSVAGLTIDFEFDDDGNPIKAGFKVVSPWHDQNRINVG